MNTARDISDRLLRLYPVAVVKEHFNKAHQGQDHLLREIVAENATSVIDAFALDQTDRTKEHVYIYECRGVPRFDLSELGKEAPDRTSEVAGFTVNKYLLEVDSEILVKEKKEFVTLTNKWPVSIYFKRGIVILRITILDRYIKYFGNANVVNLGQGFSESSIRDVVVKSLFSNNSNPVPLDITKGVKELLKKDLIDATNIKFKKDKSTSTEALDEEHTLKVAMPDVYDDMMGRPIEKTVFKFLGNQDDQYPNHFRVEPQKGEISFSLYATDTDAHTAAIKLILENN
ncbi:hypothetical protein [Dyadobacter sp. Leaf189]|uniref:hypothetical protein n=1 Tax=Dyadobacter sp. Leaf189 TaxID=1736295 RepID=UPI0006FFC3D2|nr:hypothetical protein [Dyadobacter sp. Leaf189]KQS34019.1 hypothetical protein ASG33_08290 [Dyadobacter sp. Leaf189]